MKPPGFRHCCISSRARRPRPVWFPRFSTPSRGWLRRHPGWLLPRQHHEPPQKTGGGNGRPSVWAFWPRWLRCCWSSRCTRQIQQIRHGRTKVWCSIRRSPVWRPVRQGVLIEALRGLPRPRPLQRPVMRVPSQWPNSWGGCPVRWEAERSQPMR